MPCQDYQPSKNETELSDRNNLLARVACNIMQTLASEKGFTHMGEEDIIAQLREMMTEAGVSTNHRNEVVTWWNAHRKADALAMARKKEAVKRKKLLASIHKKLTPEELKLIREL